MKSFIIDPVKITNFEATKDELELLAIFWVCVAGKTALVISKALNNLLLDAKNKYGNLSPLKLIKAIGSKLPQELKRYGVGCYQLKGRALLELADSNLNLRTCTVNDLEAIYGIGPKTARCFLLHSRRDAQVAGLDTHVLKYMKELGYDVPDTTPTGKKYLKIEQQFLELAKKAGMDTAAYDLEIWNYMRTRAKV